MQMTDHHCSEIPPGDENLVVPRIVVGNAAMDGAGDTRGWFIGHFVLPSESPRHTNDVEVKWGIHPAGHARARMATATEATTLVILISGLYRVRFPHGDVLLSGPSDYVLFPPGVPHGAVADEDSVILTVRWPSKLGDAVEHDDDGSWQAGGI